MGPWGYLGPTWGPGAQSGAKLGETVFNFGLHFDLILIVVHIILFPGFGVVKRLALGTLFGPKGCPSGAKGSLQRRNGGNVGAFWVSFW